MSSETDICNNALIKIGEDPITSFAEESKAGRLCNQLYASTRDAVLRAHPWNFAIERVELAQLSAAPAYEYTNQFKLPTDCLRVLQMETVDMIFKIEGRELLTDQGTAKIKYIKKITDVNEFDALFSDALSSRLAAELAQPLAASKTLAEEMWNLYFKKIGEARGIDAQEGTPDDFPADTWLDSRY